MNRWTPDRHAEEVAWHLQKSLAEALASPDDCAMVVMLLYALGYTIRQVNLFLIEHDVSTTTDHLSAGIELYRKVPKRRWQYQHMIERLKNPPKHLREQ